MCSRSSMRSLQDIKVCVITSSNTAFLLVVCAQRHTGLIPGRGGDKCFSAGLNMLLSLAKIASLKDVHSYTVQKRL